MLVHLLLRYPQTARSASDAVEVVRALERDFLAEREQNFARRDRSHVPFIDNALTCVVCAIQREQLTSYGHIMQMRSSGRARSQR